LAPALKAQLNSSTSVVFFAKTYGFDQ